MEQDIALGNKEPSYSASPSLSAEEDDDIEEEEDGEHGLAEHRNSSAQSSEDDIEEVNLGEGQGIGEMQIEHGSSCKNVPNNSNTARSLREGDAGRG